MDNFLEKVELKTAFSKIPSFEHRANVEQSSRSQKDKLQSNKKF